VEIAACDFALTKDDVYEIISDEGNIKGEKIRIAPSCFPAESCI
jgi:hypothetical protein